MCFHLKRLLVKVVIDRASPEKKSLAIVLRLLKLQVVMVVGGLMCEWLWWSFNI
jgi:hypothetical protein